MKKGHDCGGSAFNAPEVSGAGTVLPRSGSSDIADPSTMSFNYFYLEKCRFDHIIDVSRNDPAS